MAVLKKRTISSPSVRYLKLHSLPQALSAYALPSFSHCSHFVAHGRLSQKHMPRLLTVMHTWRFKGYWDAPARHTLRLHTPSISIEFLVIRAKSNNFNSTSTNWLEYINYQIFQEMGGVWMNRGFVQSNWKKNACKSEDQSTTLYRYLSPQVAAIVHSNY